MHARPIAVRRLLLLGRLDAAASSLSTLDRQGLPPALQAVAELATAELALRPGIRRRRPVPLRRRQQRQGARRAAA